MIVTRYLAIAALAITNVAAIANIDQTVSDIQEITHKLRVAKRTIDNFNGGLPSALKIANTVYQAHAAAEVARKHIGNSDPFSGADSEQTMKAYHEFQPVLVSTIQSGQVKAPEIRKAGFGYIAQGMLHNLYQEKSLFEDAMHGQLSSNHSQMVKPAIGEVDTEFKRIIEAFQN